MDGGNEEIGGIEKCITQVTLNSSDDRSHHSTNESTRHGYAAVEVAGRRIAGLNHPSTYASSQSIKTHPAENRMRKMMWWCEKGEKEHVYDTCHKIAIRKFNPVGSGEYQEIREYELHILYQVQKDVGRSAGHAQLTLGSPFVDCLSTHEMEQEHDNGSKRKFRTGQVEPWRFNSSEWVTTKESKRRKDFLQFNRAFNDDSCISKDARGLPKDTILEGIRLDFVPRAGIVDGQQGIQLSSASNVNIATNAMLSVGSETISITCVSNQANSLTRNCNEFLGEIADKNPFHLPPSLKELEGTTHTFQFHFDSGITSKRPDFVLDTVVPNPALPMLALPSKLKPATLLTPTAAYRDPLVTQK
ncbi:hypothetical protein Tco_0425583 [Tanacetum coccineum]